MSATTAIQNTTSANQNRRLPAINESIATTESKVRDKVKEIDKNK